VDRVILTPNESKVGKGVEREDGSEGTIGALVTGVTGGNYRASFLEEQQQRRRKKRILKGGSGTGLN